MKIYQVHRSGGEWEDYYNYIVASYLHEENAMKKKEELVHKEMKLRDKAEECRECYDKYFYDDTNKPCPKDCCKIIVYNDGDIECSNRYDHWENENYFIETLEIEDA